jgi:hypothetical protein
MCALLWGTGVVLVHLLQQQKGLNIPESSNEDLNLIFSWQPFPGFRVPIRESEATCAPIPGFTFKEDQLFSPVP